MSNQNHHRSVLANHTSKPDEIRKILCVDDEPNILNALKRLLRREDYEVITANSGEEGLAQLSQHSVHVVITDQRMPGMQGTDFLQKVKEQYPDTVRLVLSGYADTAVILDAINKGEVYRFIPKPWQEEEFRLFIRQCFEHYDILRQNKTLLKELNERNEQLNRLNRQLETMVSQQAHTLNLSYEVLDKLALPIIGVSAEGFVVMINQAAIKLGLWGIGDELSHYLDPARVNQITQAIIQVKSITIESFVFQGMPFRIVVEPLLEEDQARGCLLILEQQSLITKPVGEN